RQDVRQRRQDERQQQATAAEQQREQPGLPAQRGRGGPGRRFGQPGGVPRQARRARYQQAEHGEDQVLYRLQQDRLGTAQAGQFAGGQPPGDQEPDRLHLELPDQRGGREPAG